MVVQEQVRSAIVYSTILVNTMDEIKLRKVGEPEFNSLPYGIRLVLVGNTAIFVRRTGGRFLPVEPQLQKELTEKHIRKEE